jgi:tRNA(adenine34) deaminase
MNSNKDQLFMQAAFEWAEKGAAKNEVPVGAVVVDPGGHILAGAHNETKVRLDPSAHAEVLALRAAAQKIGVPILLDCTLYVTLEPCPLCAHAISLFRIKRLVFGAFDPKGGGVDHGACLYQQSTCHHAPFVVGGIHEKICGDLLKKFFATKR